jgi:hypothetical protein
MAILRDYYCESHGVFEAWEPECPMKHCKATISIIHLKPVGMKSAKTAKTDKTLEGLAQDFGMTDIKSTREGEHQTGYLKRNNKLTDKEFAQATEAMQANEAQKQGESRPGDAAIWGAGGNISMKSVMGGQFKSLAGEPVGINPREAGNLTGPKPASYIPDHENLSIPKP